ncbi:hypothetical protein AJ79_00146 [Helicocarpus griseus UAMH5409]|uniref:Allergen Asp f 4 n=1 Tax=Helicocarpus griseus UAMH5409 TaxID=1447875 RepID=A0A2B7YCH3_9EURO|nr:hypothetical protein AJ79_00146 [Helicocarpus griseus UAMH5409]
MQLKTTLALLAALTPFTQALPHAKRADWTSTPQGDGKTDGFGTRQTNGAGSIDTYQGNIGSPWGSNIIEISEADASQYKYVAKLHGANTEPNKVVFWNKFGPDGKLDGHYGREAISFTLQPGEDKYVAFDENTQGGFGAYPGDDLPKGPMGAYACTWGEFDFGSEPNNRWSGFDVSAIQANMAGKEVQGMKICEAPGGVCSSITPDGAADNAYTAAETDIGGIGANLAEGPVRLDVTIGYEG